MSQNIAIVGAGICGMCTAISLADQGHTITLYERDVAPPEGDPDAAFFDWQRRGAAQFRHPHAFLGLVCNLFQDRYPELMARLFEAGARKVSFAEMLPPVLRQDYVPQPGDERLWVLMCRRATMETVIRRYVEGLPNVSLVNRLRVTGVLTREHIEAQREVYGLTVRDPGSESDREVLADLIIDASGRTSKFPRWLEAQGVSIAEEHEDAEIVYYTRHYRLREGRQEPPRGEKQAAGDLRYLKFGVFPGDNGHFAVILCVPLAETRLREAVRDPAQFDAICRAIPGVEQWMRDDMAVATTDSFGIGDIRAVWRRFVADAETEDDARGQPAAVNFFAVGDAAMRTNPLYGRGCSTGVMSAGILADVLAESDDPVQRARRYAQRSREELRPIYDASLTEDRNGKKRAEAVMSGRDLDRADSLKKWFGLAFGDALAAASRSEIEVVRGLMRTVNLLEKPGAFLQDKHLRRKIYRYMLRGRRRNAASREQPGPDRAEMLKLLGA